jgi:hypothetical protein
VQAEAVALGGGVGAAGTGGADIGADDVDDIEDPPPQALKAAINTVQVAASNQWLEDSSVGRCERCCMEGTPWRSFSCAC